MTNESIGEGHDRTTSRIGYELKEAQHALRLRMDEALRGYGVTTPQYAAMSVLAEQPGLSNAQLARRSFLTPQTMNQILGKLGGGGWWNSASTRITGGYSKRTSLGTGSDCSTVVTRQ